MVIIVTLNTLGPCRQQWAFADDKANEVHHADMSKRLDGHDGSIKVLQGTVQQIDQTTWRIWCATQFRGQSKSMTAGRAACEKEKPAPPKAEP